MEIKYIEVAFENNGKRYSFSPNDLDLKNGDVVVVDTSNGQELGYCVSDICLKEMADFVEPLKNVVRFATAKDIALREESNKKQEEIKAETEEIVKNSKLDMKIVSANLNLYGNKITISFTSDNRVDFRDLVKELAAKFKARIELRQIGARDETKELGGLGPCGRECCCHLFLTDCEHASIKMAKVQGLSLNPTKISGLCGRLKCCLAYENNHYSEAFNLMPKVNTEVVTPKGKGLVVYNDLLKRKSTVRFMESDGSYEEKDFDLSELKFNKGK